MARSPKTPDTTKPDTTEAAAQAIASPPVTFDLNDPTLRAMLAQAVAVALAAQKAELMQTMAATKPATNGKSDRSLKNEIAVVKAFKKAGFGDVRPHEDVRTFNRWVAAGYRPVEGSRSIKTNNLRLFCRAQCRPITPEEKQAAKAQSEAAVARHTAEVIPMSDASSQ
jgi:hypothetical protein